MLRRLREFFKMMTGNLGVIVSSYPGVRFITYISISVFVVQFLSWHISMAPLASELKVIPMGAVIDRYFGIYWPFMKEGAFWQPITFAFLHGSIWHLVINLFTLIFLGYSVERVLGTGRFWIIFLLSSALGGIGWMLFDFVEPTLWQYVSSQGGIGRYLAERWATGQLPVRYNCCVGASAGIFGLMGAFVALFPREKITILLMYVCPVTMQARHIAVILVIFNLFELMTSFGRVAYVAHLFGGMAGYLIACHYKRIWQFFARL